MTERDNPGRDNPGRDDPGRDDPGRRADRPSRDPVLIVLVALLVATLAAFALGWQPYPFGVLVLGLFIAARLLHRRSRDSD